MSNAISRPAAEKQAHRELLAAGFSKSGSLMYMRPGLLRPITLAEAAEAVQSGQLDKLIKRNTIQIEQK